MSIDFKNRSIIVSGTTVVVDTETDLEVSFDLGGDMSKVASHMAWWGSVWAEAEAERVRVDAAYRQWRAQKVAKVDPKGNLAEWRVKAAIEADPEFIKHKNAIARTEGNVTAARSQHDSFGKKANTLQSKGAMARREQDATGMTTPEHPKPAPQRSAPRPSGGVSAVTPAPKRVAVQSHKEKLAAD